MLIVCTQDAEIRRWTNDRESGSARWSPVSLISDNLNQNGATRDLQSLLNVLGRTEVLCLSAHGNDTEIGDEDDEGWTWTTTDIAAMLARNPKHQGPILIHACSRSIANFAAGLAVELEKIRALNGVWIYGYNKPVPRKAKYPDPNTLDKQAELQGTRVRF